MKKVLVSLVLVLSLTVVAQTNKLTQKLPEISLKDLEGHTVNVADYGRSGKIHVINFWATWCKPCIKELVNIHDEIDTWREKYNMELIAVSVDDAKTVQGVKAFVDGRGWDYKVLLDVNGDLKRAMNVQNPPFTALVDAEGNIVYQHSGYVEGNEDELVKKMEELIAKK